LGFGEVPMATAGKTVLAIVLLGTSALGMAADISAGRLIAQSKCVECHEADDWEGESAASLESIIRDIIDGKVKHKRKIELNAPEIANVAAYWGAGKN
jgi:mono/diheme cytochrome c family protein